MTNFFILNASDSVKIQDGAQEADINSLGSVGVGFPLWNENVSTKAWHNSSTSGTLHTVPAGKKCYVLGFTHAIADYGNSRSGYSLLTSSAGALSYVKSSSYSSTGGASATSNTMDLSKFPMVLTAGQTITYSLSSANSHSGVVYYIEVDA